MLQVLKGHYSTETLAKLRRLPPLDDERYGRRWQPLPHHELADAVLTIAAERYGRVRKPQLLLSPDWQSLIGTFELPDLAASDAYVPAGVFRHDNKQGRALLLGAGGKVFVCENGIISCSWQVKTKHERHVNFENWIENAVASIGPAIMKQAAEVEIMGLNIMEHAGEAFLDLHVKDDLPSSLAFRAYQEWQHPRHEVFEARTQWSWYNSVTQAAKDLSPNTQTRALEAAFLRAPSYS